MTAPNMAAITAALEKSLQNCSLNHHNHRQDRAFLAGKSVSGERSSSSGDPSPAAAGQISSSSDTTLELNSHLSLPYHWEQCLDLKTGEIYYINWKTGMKAKEDPRITSTTSTEEEEYINSELYYDEEEDEEEEGESSYESEESSSEYSSPPSCSRQQQPQQQHNYRQQMKKKEEQVLVVAGCKGCLMYFMVPKQVEDCPKCNGQLLHFDRSESSSP